MAPKARKKVGVGASVRGRRAAPQPQEAPTVFPTLPPIEVVAGVAGEDCPRCDRSRTVANTIMCKEYPSAELPFIGCICAPCHLMGGKICKGISNPKLTEMVNANDTNKKSWKNGLPDFEADFCMAKKTGVRNFLIIIRGSWGEAVAASTVK